MSSTPSNPTDDATMNDPTQNDILAPSPHCGMTLQELCLDKLSDMLDDGHFERENSIDKNINHLLLIVVHMATVEDNPRVQLKACTLLADISRTEHTQAIADAGAIPVLLSLINRSDRWMFRIPRKCKAAESAESREQCLWCLGNLASESDELKEVLIEIMAPCIVVSVLREDDGTSDAAFWALKCLLSEMSFYDAGMNEYIIASISRIISLSIERFTFQLKWCPERNPVLKCQHLQLLEHVTNQGQKHVIISLQEGIDSHLQFFNENLKSEDDKLVDALLGALGNLILFGRPNLMEDLDRSMLEVNLTNLIDRVENASIQKKTCSLLSAIIAQTQRENVKEISRRFKRLIVDIFVKSYDPIVKMEAIRFLCNIVTHGMINDAALMGDAWSVGAICSGLDYIKVDFLILVLDALNRIIESGPSSFYKSEIFVTRCGGLLKIHNMQHHDEFEVRKRATCMIGAHFKEYYLMFGWKKLFIAAISQPLHAKGELSVLWYALYGTKFLLPQQ